MAISSRNELLAAVLERLELWFRRLDVRPGELYEANHMSDKVMQGRKNTSNVKIVKGKNAVQKGLIDARERHGDWWSNQTRISVEDSSA